MKLLIEKMKCSGCVDNITRVLSSLDPVAKPAFDLKAHTVEVETAVDRQVMLDALAAAGYPATVL
ncbi:heavy-metal-associated domain-containing protein [Daeguia caeni]|uniref:Heavy-metal-associated domain-containing protein n=1 Tax=Daeguia caeni TaxID=439612 RepID=A0ABV9H7I3_9HYPH